MQAPDEAERAGLKTQLERIADDDVRARAAEAVAPLLDGRDGRRPGRGSADQQRWQSWCRRPSPAAAGAPNYKADLTDYLTKLMCSARWSNGSVATGVARRAVAQQFRGDVVAVYDGLKSRRLPGVDQDAGQGHARPVRRRPRPARYR